VYVIPWLATGAETSFGEVTMAPWDVPPILDDDVRTSVEAIMASYRGLGDAPMRPTLMWRTGTDPFGQVDADLAMLSDSANCLAVAAIAENDYFTGEPITAAHTASFYQRFMPGSTTVGILKRRRDGRYSDGWPLDKLHFTVPLAASVQSFVTPVRDFLEALVTVVNADDELAVRIQESIPFFLMANVLSETSPLLFDLVWLGAAFERLFGLEVRGVAQTLGARLTSLFGAFPQTAAPDWTLFGGKPQSGPWIARWANEFYDQRSTIHINPPRSNLWSQELHAVIATVVYGLAVKCLLKEVGLYELGVRDRHELTVLDPRIVVAGDADPVERWRQAR
jgi:hypothetical protein